VVNTFWAGTTAAGDVRADARWVGRRLRDFVARDRAGKQIADVPAERRWQLSFAVLALFELGVVSNSLPKGTTKQLRRKNYSPTVTATMNGTKF
jgi:hypothetical protein